MRSAMNVTLPPTLRGWVETQVRTRGIDTASEFVRDMIRRELEKTLRDSVDRTLLAAMKTPVSEMTDQDWDDIQREGRQLARKRKRQ